MSISKERLNEFDSKWGQEVKDGAILNIFGRQQELANDFYRRIAE